MASASLFLHAIDTGNTLRRTSNTGQPCGIARRIRRLSRRRLLHFAAPVARLADNEKWACGAALVIKSAYAVTLPKIG